METFLDKMTELLNDATLEGVSSCCGAKVYQGDICAECREHCDAVTEE